MIREALLHHRELANGTWYANATSYQHIIMYALAKSKLESINAIIMALAESSIMYPVASTCHPKTYPVPSDLAMRKITSQAYFQSRDWKEHVKKQQSEIEREKQRKKGPKSQAPKNVMPTAINMVKELIKSIFY